MGWGRLRERLLREPDNLFGPPTGHGYDYPHAGITVAALAVSALSGWAVYEAATRPDLHPAVGWSLLILCAPFVVTVFCWPVGWVVGWAGSALQWYATLHTLASLTGRLRCGRVARVGWAAVAVFGWVGWVASAIALRQR